MVDVYVLSVVLVPHEVSCTPRRVPQGRGRSQHFVFGEFTRRKELGGLGGGVIGIRGVVLLVEKNLVGVPRAGLPTIIVVSI